MSTYIGYFDSADQQEPTLDPPHDGPCMVCDKPLEVPVVTISMVWAENAKRSYFYRAHRDCYDANPKQADGFAWAHIEAMERGAKP